MKKFRPKVNSHGAIFSNNLKDLHAGENLVSLIQLTKVGAILLSHNAISAVCYKLFLQIALYEFAFD